MMQALKFPALLCALYLVLGVPAVAAAEGLPSFEYAGIGYADPGEELMVRLGEHGVKVGDTIVLTDGRKANAATASRREAEVTKLVGKKSVLVKVLR